MSNPTFRSGPITLPAADTVAAGHLVTLGADGVEHAGAADAVFGAVSSPAAPVDPEGDSYLPDVIAVHTAPASLPLVTEGDFALGATVYAGADGTAAASGTVPVGIAVAASAAGKVRTRLTVPTAADPA